VDAQRLTEPAGPTSPAEKPPDASRGAGARLFFCQAAFGQGLEKSEALIVDFWKRDRLRITAKLLISFFLSRTHAWGPA